MNIKFSCFDTFLCSFKDKVNVFFVLGYFLDILQKNNFFPGLLIVTASIYKAGSKHEKAGKKFFLSRTTPKKITMPRLKNT